MLCQPPLDIRFIAAKATHRGSSLYPLSNKIISHNQGLPPLSSVFPTLDPNLKVDGPDIEPTILLEHIIRIHSLKVNLPE